MLVISRRVDSPRWRSRRTAGLSEELVPVFLALALAVQKFRVANNAGSLMG
jgi:hypothetical protein